MKKLIILTVVILSVLLIYLGFKDEKLYYLSMGDGLSVGSTPFKNKDYGYSEYIKEYLEEKKINEKYVNYSFNNMHTTDLINDIKENKLIKVEKKEKHLQNVLIKADLITLSIGTNDFLNNLNLTYDHNITDLYKTFSQSLEDMEKLFILMRQYCKERIILIGYYDHTNNDNLIKFFNHVNIKTYDLASQYNIEYIEIPPSFYETLNKSNYPTKEGYKILADTIIKRINIHK